MSISLGARPNFIQPLNNLDYLSIELFLFECTKDCLIKLLDQSSNLSTVGFECLYSFGFTLNEMNAGHIHFPHLQVLKLEYRVSNIHPFLLEVEYFKLVKNLLVDSKYEESLKPGSFRFILNDHPITLEHFKSIVGVQEKFGNLSDDPTKVVTSYLKFSKGKRDRHRLQLCFLGYKSSVCIERQH